MLFKLDHILNDVEKHINNKKGFSILRLGDGDLKMLNIMLNGGYAERKFRQQGIPNNRQEYKKLFKIIRTSCNNANYVSNFDVYFDSENYWGRNGKDKTLTKMKLWKDIYQNVGIVNTNYCSPEIGVYMCLRRKRNLFSLMKNRKVGLITPFERVSNRLNNIGYNTEAIVVPGRFGKHSSYYDETRKNIIGKIKEFDFFIVGAGFYGRGYSEAIRINGGVCVDVGQVFDVWNGTKIPKRIVGLINYHGKRMDFTLTERGKKYKGAI